MPTSPAGQGVSAPDDVDGDDWGMGTGGDQSDSGLCFSQVTIEGALTFGKKNEGSLLFEDFKNIFQRGGPWRVLIHRNGADGGEEPRADWRGEESVAGEVVRNPAHVATHSGWIKEAGMVRGKNEGSGGEGVSTFTADGVEEAKEGVGKDAAAVKPDGANLHGTVGAGVLRVRTSRTI